MAGNSFGREFVLTTCGESHGAALLGIIDGCPPQVRISEEIIQRDLDRRRPGSTKYGTPRNESDTVKIVSGVFEGYSTGTPIGLVIENQTQRSQDYSDIKDKYRPSHADYTYANKYGIRDYRGGGRASARETAMRVAAGAIAKEILLQRHNIKIDACVTQIGSIVSDVYDAQFAKENQFNFADKNKLDELKVYFESIMESKDSCGAVIEVRAYNVPVGFGNPVFDRLDALIAHAMMSINAVKAVEIGDGFKLAGMKGSEARDEISHNGFLSNHSGGILGGISSGQDITVRIALKPTSSIQVSGSSIDIYGNDIDIVTKGRHDPCVGIRAVVIAEAMLALTLVDSMLCHKAQCSEVKHNFYKL